MGKIYLCVTELSKTLQKAELQKNNTKDQTNFKNLLKKDNK